MITSPTTAFPNNNDENNNAGGDPRPIINLREFVQSVTKHNSTVFADFNISPKWRCRLVPEFDEDEKLINNNNNTSSSSSAYQMMHFFANGVPALAAQKQSQPVHDICRDAMEFISDPKWNHFPTPKIAFRGGWAGPGTKMEDDKLHQMVRGFDEVLDASKCATDEELAKQYEVLKSDQAEEEAKKKEEQQQQQQTERATNNISIKGENDDNDDAKKNKQQTQKQQHTSDEILNLQLFHRSDSSLHPQLPILSENLKWPECVREASVVCDNATRVSKAGAVTWWHLDDCGEFVMQTGLDRRDPEKHLEGVKLFIYGPSASYDWFMHDFQSDANKSGKIAALDILKAPCDALPPAEYLPIVNVAVLRAGGRPLISPPNIPHIVVTLRDCVMVEQRRVMFHFLHEVLYFAQRMQAWKSTPVVYPVLGKTLQEEDGVMDVSVQIAKQLERVLETTSSSNNNNNNNNNLELKRLNAALCVRSLLALTNSQLFKGAGVNEERIGDRVRQIFSSFAEKIMPFFDVQYLIGAETQFLETYCDLDRTCWMHFDDDATFIFKLYKNNTRPIITNQNSSGREDEEEKGFSCVLYYGGDIIEDTCNSNNNSNGEKKKKGNEDEEEQEHPVVSKLKNGFLPCWIGQVFETVREARNAGRKGLANLKANASSKKGEALKLTEIVEAFAERDEMLDEFF